MNTTQLITLSLVAFASTAALADDITIDRSSFASTTSRAAVKADVQRARAQGTLMAAGEFAPVQPQVQTAMTREAMRAEVRAANQKHELLPAGEALNLAATSVRGSRLN